MTVRISEYYDLFDIKLDTTSKDPDTYTETTIKTDNLPKEIKPTGETNPFRGFNNFPTNIPGSSVQPYNANNSQYEVIHGQIKAPQAITNIKIDDNGDIWCYPPNVSVPYWNKIIFRNFDYYYNRTAATVYDGYVELFQSQTEVEYPSYTYDSDEGTVVPSDENTVTITNYNTKYSEVPIFLKFDEYPSRSKVVFSSVDKTRNPDIEHRFSYRKGQMEPIKLNMSFSCNNPITDGVYLYNHTLPKPIIDEIFVKCYWSIEWVYERETGN